MKIMQIWIKRNTPILLLVIALALGAFVFLPANAFAVSPAPDGGYAGGNTAEGQSALLSLSTGLYNTGIGEFSLLSVTDASFNTGVGAGTLLANIGPENTATGAGALLSNITGGDNTADGVFALFSNTEGHDNTATGDFALFTNSTGSNNTASGRLALQNSNADSNTAIGAFALQNTTTGSNNTALGYQAGNSLDTGDNNIDIGFDVVGVAGESNTIRIGNTDITDTFIRGISGATASGGAAVFVNGNGKLGTMTSSARFKDQIEPMGNASEVILLLTPMSFRYKKEIDPQRIPQFGLVAEDVAKISPNLVIRDAEGKPQTVRYEQINAMLLNEFLKAHHKIEGQQTQIDALTAQLKEQAAEIQTVKVQLELKKPAPQTVASHPLK
jgi:hypothetical protein